MDVQGNIAKRSGNSYTAWREVTPLHNKLVDRVLQCPMHVAVTLRTKTEYVIEDNGQGKKAPKKVGLAPVFREGIEYEFTIFFELAQDHVASATKDRTSVFDGRFFTISPETGVEIFNWLTGAPANETPPLVATSAQGELAADESDEKSLPELVDQAIKTHCTHMTREEKAAVASEIKEITGGTANYRAVTDEAILRRIYEKYKEA